MLGGRRRGRRAFATAAVIVLLTACSDVKPEPTRTDAAPLASTPAPSATPQPAPTDSTDTPVEASTRPATPEPAPTTLPPSKSGVLVAGVADQILRVGDEPRVTIIAPGQEPHEPVRYALAEHKTWTTGMKVDLEMQMEVGTEVTPVRMPTVGMNMQLRSGARDAKAGTIPIHGEITKVAVIGDADPRAKEKLGDAMSKMKGMSIQYVLTDEGRVREVHVSLPDESTPIAQQLADQMKESFSSMVAPLPHEPIGVGATWQSITRIVSGVDALQYTTYRLKQRKGDAVEVETEVKQLAAKDVVIIPGSAGPAPLKSFTSTGTGQMTLDLRAPNPSKGTTTMRGTMELSPQNGVITVDTGVQITFGPAIP